MEMDIVAHRIAAAKKGDVVSVLEGVEEEEQELGITPLTLTTAPFQTLSLFSQVVFDTVKSLVRWAVKHKVSVVATAALAAVVGVLLTNPSEQYAPLAESIRYEGTYAVYWLVLGILSSVGLGSGFHTFLLYLGPHIVWVTQQAGLCGSVAFSAKIENFLLLKYADDAFDCPRDFEGEVPVVPMLAVVQKVMYPAFLWGVGTAIGELPPYFMARAARLSGEKLKELQELEEEESQDASKLSMLERAKLATNHLIQRWGFWAILAAASIPNPLFDLAGVTCGHFLIPFWTFFFATAIGKGIIKVSGQTAFYVIASRPQTLASLRDAINWMLDSVASKAAQAASRKCWTGTSLEECHNCCSTLFKAASGAGRHACDATCGQDGEGSNVIGTLWNYFIIAMMGWFLVSIITSAANERLIEQTDARRANARQAKVAAKRRAAEEAADRADGAETWRGRNLHHVDAAVVEDTAETKDIDVVGRAPETQAPGATTEAVDGANNNGDGDDIDDGGSSSDDEESDDEGSRARRTATTPMPADL